MLTFRKVAVTGGLASGKTLVCHFFQELGAYVLSSDEIVHRLLSSDTDLIQKVSELVGSDVLVNDKVDRSRVAKKVFNQPVLLKSLEDLIHPLVRNEIEKEYQVHKDSLFVVEVPLLFEAGFDKDFEITIAVLANEATCKDRSSKNYDERMSRQMTPEEKAKRASFVIENNGTREELKEKVKTIYQQIGANTP